MPSLILMLLKEKDRVRISAIVIGYLVISYLLWFIFGELILILAITVLLSLILTFQLESHRRLEAQLAEIHKKTEQNHAQTESMHNLFSVLPITHPLPPMRNWALLPDAATFLVTQIEQHKPKTILELGSGVSTIISAYALKQRGEGRVISIEHEKAYAAKTNRNLSTHGLSSYAKVIHAPLKPVKIGNRSWRWYDASRFDKLKNIDMLVVDGPPGNVQKYARYPAVPILYKKLGAKAVVLLDDAKRTDELWCVDRWREQYKNLSYRLVDTQKGMAVLAKK